MSQFDPANHMYRITVPLNQPRPFVHVEAAEPMQNIHIQHADTTIITVTAEDQTTKDTYTLIFIYQKSPYAYLKGIYQDGNLINGFRPDSVVYDILLPYGTKAMPHFTYELGIEGQHVDIDTVSTNDKGQAITYYSFIVTAPNEENSCQYDVRVTTALNDDCSLQTLRINGKEIADFHPDTLAYQIIYPIGTDSAALITQESIQAITNDPKASVVITNDGYNFTIIVTAHDGQNMRVYTLEQIILLSSNTRLNAIYVDGKLLRDFDPELLQYTYYVEDVQPEVIATAEDSTTTVEYSIYTADQPFYIYVTAQDGSEQIYTIDFQQTTISSSIQPTANDVLVKHLGGMDFAVATLRKNVSIGVYTAHGNMIFLSKVTETSQNDAIIGTNADGTDQLLDVTTHTTQFTLPEKDQIFFYIFFENDKHRIKSGKLMVH